MINGLQRKIVLIRMSINFSLLQAQKDQLNMTTARMTVETVLRGLIDQMEGNLAER